MNELTVPIKVIRKACLNPLAHRTWWSEAMTPSVAIFDDRIKFKNPLTPYMTGDGNGGVNGGVNDLSERLQQIYTLIDAHPGIKAHQVADKLSRPLPTVEKQLSTLKKKELIEYRGSAKTGGYHIK